MRTPVSGAVITGAGYPLLGFVLSCVLVGSTLIALRLLAASAR